MTDPNHRPWVVAIAASAGGVGALMEVLAQLPADFPAAVVVIQHRSATNPSVLEEILSRRTALRVGPASAGAELIPGGVYIARPDLHLRVDRDCRFEYVNGTRVRGLLSAANPLLESAAPVLRDRLIAVVLTGTGLDATDGVQSVKAHGGTVIAQDEATSQFFGMPGSAIRTGAVDRILPLGAIGPTLVEIVTGAHDGGAKRQHGQGASL